MFLSHQPPIGQYARQSPDNLLDVLTFVQLTIRQPLHTVPAAMRNVRAEQDDSHYLWGFKAEAFRYASKHRTVIYSDALNLFNLADPARSESELLDYFATMQGFGLVKAGFMLQLCFGLVGCIDSHNLEQYRLRPRAPMFEAWAYKQASLRHRQTLRNDYLHICRSLGGPCLLWDKWCNYVANRHTGLYRDAFQVSKLHCDAIL